MKEITSHEGADHFRAWGLPDFQPVEGRYYLWDDCCVLLTIPKRDPDSGVEYLECHIAMEKGQRHRCREAVYDIIQLFGDQHMLAPVLPDRKSVENLLRKMGFTLISKELTTLVDGRRVELTMMLRFKNGWNC